MCEPESNADAPWAVLLAGGQSTRFGSDKARIDIGGVPLLRRNHDLLSATFAKVCVVGPPAAAYADLGLACIPDDTPHRGPMAGVIAALHARLTTLGPGPVAVCACDTLLTAQAVGQLHTMAAALNAPAPAPAAVAGHDGHRWQPLFAAYPTHALPSLRAALGANRASLSRWLDARANPVVRHPMRATLPSFNTPEELAQLNRESR